MTQPSDANLSLPVSRLEVEGPFSQLTKKERFHIYYATKAAVACSRVVLKQVSPESSAIFDLVVALGNACNCNWQSLAISVGVEIKTVHQFLEYAARVLNSLGNYEGITSKKIVPGVTRQDFERICSFTPLARQLFESVSAQVLAPEPSSIGFPDSGGMSAYYEGEITKAEIKSVTDFLMAKGYLLQNTRLLKRPDHGSAFTYVVRIASEAAFPPSNKANQFAPLEYQPGVMIEFSFGDFAEEMAEVRRLLQQAARFADDEKSLEHFNFLDKFFYSGDIQNDIKASAAWVKASTQTVEANFGFLSGYRDPAGVRRSMEAIIAIQDKTKVHAVDSLVGIADNLLGSMPWVTTRECPDDSRFGAFELPNYIRPEFMSLNLLWITAVQCWYAMMGPTYQSVRDTVGKKNLYFANSVAAFATKEYPFLKPEDTEIFSAHSDGCSAVMLYTHELIGHGCGKLLAETEPSIYNFDVKNLPRSGLTEKPISSWYKLGQTPKSVFGGLYSTLSECIADAVALFLLPRRDILSALEVIKEPTEDDVANFEYVGYLSFINQALRSLPKYDVVQQKWGQAHGRARFIILKHLYEHGNGTLKMAYRPRTTELPPSLTIHLDRSRLSTDGRAAISNLLHRLHIYKCTGDAETGIPDLEAMTLVSGDYLLWHEIVSNQAKPPPLIVQGNLFLIDEKGKQINVPDSKILDASEAMDVVLRQYEPTVEGLVRSWVERRGG